ncbi:MAG: phosphatidylserine decarboxylase [Candidatus Glassbacteria bacterium RIFCSPLOWO2_12_FULL_58_11]|uniref:Phosphatidylserine decarboxylase proenzyme n=1 Tax=Candidatus Glassbacteria bacterium RIFCSPLOWO2_12_FULL_58_11 TaxID=1817867 RepID=A0A1F5YMH7_9BACT|nr:MAG: phosphatidylserine decarboxylase [Candidatus Glassbacteria bacterium RIFCSPLOWO2_12_FULL_58_11]
MKIAREGAPIIIALIGIHLVCLAGGLWLAGKGFRSGIFLASAFVFALLALFSLYFFRDPERNVPPGGKLVVSPADGRVLALDDIPEEQFIRGPARRLSIFMNVFDVHVNRAPVAGTVKSKVYRKGKFFNASLDKASAGNEALSLGIESSDPPCRVLVRQIAGLIARRIVCHSREGDRLERGERFGMIRFGSRVEVYLPARSTWRVAVGDRVVAGESILAELP